MSPRPRNPFRRAGEVVEQTLKRFGLAQGIRSHRAFEVWEEAVGPQVAAHASPERISNRVLRIRVDHNTWLQQLHFMKALILARLNDRLGEGTFIDIELRLGRPRPPESREPQPAPPPPLPPPLSPDAAARIDGEISHVADPGLRSILRRIRRKQTAGG